jgi:tripartite-type tricarboxylate transporter receptor subunit TctC
MRRTPLRIALPLFVATVAGTARAKIADDVTPFYHGRQLRILVGSAVGGGYDLFARAVARHIVSHIPGNPTVIVQNLPAGGGIAMTNQLYAAGPMDGTVIGAPINGLPTIPLLQPGAAQFDATRLNWIGSTNREPFVAFVWHTVPMQNILDLRTHELVVGATTPSTTLFDYPIVTNEILGTRFKVVRGYQGTPQINLAIERGELQGVGGIGWASVKTQTPHWISEKKIRVLAQFGIRRHPELADIPNMLELAEREPDRQALTLMFARQEYGRPYFLPPGVPGERVHALRRAFDATMKDPAFLADASRLGLDVDPMTGEEVQALVAQLSSLPPAIVARVRDALQKSGK